jgi:hypothetical protein
MVSTVTRELDCISVVETIPKDRLFQVVSVVFLSNPSSTPPLKVLKPSSRESIPSRKIATPAVMVLRSGLSQNP